MPKFKANMAGRGDLMGKMAREELDAQAVRFHFMGELDGMSFVDFAEHRARRLDITLRVVESGSQSATFDVGGAPDLVDMFEMACSLGPLTCIVRDVERRDIGDAAFAAKDV